MHCTPHCKRGGLRARPAGRELVPIATAASVLRVTPWTVRNLKQRRELEGVITEDGSFVTRASLLAARHARLKGSEQGSSSLT